MSVSLSKGQRVDLTKGRPLLKNILVGLGCLCVYDKREWQSWQG